MNVLTLNISWIRRTPPALLPGEDEAQLAGMDGNQLSGRLTLRLHWTLADESSPQILGHDDDVPLLGWEDGESLVG
jgi:hypothetical protein